MNIDIQFEESNQSIDVDFGEIQIIGGSVVEATIEPLTVTENGTYTAQGNVDGYSPIHVDVPIPDGYIQPQGTIDITENGEYGITEYANAIVNVEEAKEEQEKTIDITENGTTEVTPDDGKVLSKVTVNVDVEKGITPTGTIEITENGEYDVTEYASANVSVESAAEEFVGIKLSDFTGGTYGLPKIADIRCFSSILAEMIHLTPSSSQNILSYMFANTNNNVNYGGCFSQLKEVYMPDNSLNFARSMFALCSKLDTIHGTFDEIVQVLPNAFDGCTSLVNFPYTPKLCIIHANGFKNCTGLTKFKFYVTPLTAPYTMILTTSSFTGCTNLKDIYVPWSEGEVANAPWGATNATIHYNTTYDENHNPIV